MKKILIILTCLSLMASANAVIINFEATLDGAQANAGVGTGSTATGSATMTFDDVTNEFSWDVSWTGLLGNFTVAHFHGPAAPGFNAGVALGFSSTALSIDLKSGASADSATITDDQAVDLLAGRWYINIHSTVNPGGEIRGQVVRTPDSGTTAALLGLGLISLVALRRRIC